MFAVRSWGGLAIACLVAILVAVVITAVLGVVLRSVAARRAWAELLIRRARLPFRCFLLVIVLWIAVTITLPHEVSTAWREGLKHTFLILAIASGAWFAAALGVFLADLGLARYRTDVPDNRMVRRIRTQVLIIRRLIIVAAVVVGLGAILLTFPALQAAGASILASAGVIGIIAGVAAQSTLGNLFAGIQLAFSDALRIDDVVVVEKEWGTIEEITLTYVVVHVWDDRRLVLPSTWFTTKPFENWTRQRSELLGSVEFDLDWRVSPGGMRAELNRILATTDLWDGRTGILQVTDAVAGWVRVRVLITARDAATLFDLRCLVRERLIDWMQRHSAASLPRTRVELVEAPQQQAAPARARSHEEGRLFSGSTDGKIRAAQFTDAIPVIRRDEPPADPDRRPPEDGAS